MIRDRRPRDPSRGEAMRPTLAELTTFARLCDSDGWTLAEFVDVMERSDRWFAEIRESVFREAQA